MGFPESEPSVINDKRAIEKSHLREADVYVYEFLKDFTITLQEQRKKSSLSIKGKQALKPRVKGAP